MARKTLGDRRAEKLAQLETIKRELANIEGKAGERIGKLAIKSGLADLNLDDAILLKEFQAIADRFRKKHEKSTHAPTSPASSAGTPATTADHGRT